MSDVSKITNTTPQAVDAVEVISTSKPAVKRRITNKAATKPFKRFKDAKLGYQAKAVPNSISTRPTKLYYQLHTSTNYIPTIVDLVYNQIVRRDAKMSNQFNNHTLRYVTSLAMHFRLAKLSSKLGYSVNFIDLLRLEQAATPLLLPEPLCKMVECLGSVKDDNGATYVPYVPTPTELKDSGFYTNLAEMLTNALKDTSFTAGIDKLINYPLIIDYNNATSRGFKAGILFRRVDFDRLEGTPEFLSAYTRDKSSGTLSAHTQVPTPESTAQLGASYRFRSLKAIDKWLGPDKHRVAYVHQSASFVPELFISGMLVSEFSR